MTGCKRYAAKPRPNRAAKPIDTNLSRNRQTKRTVILRRRRRPQPQPSNKTHCHPERSEGSAAVLRQIVSQRPNTTVILCTAEGLKLCSGGALPASAASDVSPTAQAWGYRATRYLKNHVRGEAALKPPPQNRSTPTSAATAKQNGCHPEAPTPTSAATVKQNALSSRTQ